MRKVLTQGTFVSVCAGCFLLSSAVARAMEVTVCPLVGDGVHQGLVDDVTGMLSLEIGFLGHEVHRMPRRPSFLDADCLTEQDCLVKVATEVEADVLVVGLLRSRHSGLLLQLQLVEGNRATQSVSEDTTASPSALADAMGGLVRELMTGERTTGDARGQALMQQVAEEDLDDDLGGVVELVGTPTFELEDADPFDEGLDEPAPPPPEPIAPEPEPEAPPLPAERHPDQGMFTVRSGVGAAWIEGRSLAAAGGELQFRAHRYALVTTGIEAHSMWRPVSPMVLESSLRQQAWVNVVPLFIGARGMMDLGPFAAYAGGDGLVVPGLTLGEPGVALGGRVRAGVQIRLGDSVGLDLGAGGGMWNGLAIQDLQMGYPARATVLQADASMLWLLGDRELHARRARQRSVAAAVAAEDVQFAGAAALITVEEDDGSGMMPVGIPSIDRLFAEVEALQVEIEALTRRFEDAVTLLQQLTRKSLPPGQIIEHLGTTLRGRVRVQMVSGRAILVGKGRVSSSNADAIDGVNALVDAAHTSVTALPGLIARTERLVQQVGQMAGDVPAIARDLGWRKRDIPAAERAVRHNLVLTAQLPARCLVLLTTAREALDTVLRTF